jgi:integrase/recombinase XerC
MSDIALSERKGMLRVWQGKGTKQRDIPLNAAARGALTQWLKIRPDTEQSYMFIGKKGVGLASGGVQGMLAEYGRRANVEVTPHTLRHSFAKNLVNAGVSLEKVAALMGHSSLNTTRLYTTPSALDLERAVAQIGE